MTQGDIKKIIDNSHIIFKNEKLDKDLIEIHTEYYNIENKYIYDNEGEILLLVDKSVDENIEYMYNSKIIIREIQKMRKEFLLKQNLLY